MEDIVLGTEDCAIRDVWTILSKSNIIKEKWSDCAGYLQIPTEVIGKLRIDLNLGKINQNDVLLQILHVWVADQVNKATLVELIRVLEDECGDNSVGEKLRLLYNLPCKGFKNASTNWSSIPPAFQKKVKQNISTFYPNITIDTVKSILKGDILLDLMTGKKPNIFKSAMPNSPNFYLKRTFLPRHTISEKVFNEDIPDIFLFLGLNEFELGKLVKQHETSTSGEQLDSTKIHVRFIVLERLNHYEEICQRSNIPVHLLSYDSNCQKLKWEKTHGQVNHLQRFVDECQNKLDEEGLVQSVKEGMRGPILISDSPGMGKSFLLANIAMELHKVGDKVIIFISVNDFIKQVKVNTYHDKNTTDSVKAALQNVVCNNDFGKIEFPVMLSSLDIKIEMLMDGFDEVNINDIALAFHVIKIINSFKSVRLWVTTRPHYLEQLEANLCALGFNIQGFDENDQINFLISHWQNSEIVRNKYNLNLDKLVDYARNVLRKIKESLNKDDKDIAGIPLQCFLIGEVFEEECINFASDKSGIKSKSHAKIRITSISDLYKNMIAKKFQKYLMTHVNTELAGTDNLIDAHVDLSIKLLFPEYKPKLDCMQVSARELLNIGIIQAYNSTGDTEFIHRTFAEYFVARHVIDNIFQEEENEFKIFFFDRILMRKNYFVQMLPESDGISSFKFVHSVICYFINANIYADTSLSTTKPTTQTLTEIYHACTNDNFLQILKYFFNKKYLGLDESLLFLAIRNSTFECFKFVFSFFGKNLASIKQQNLSSFLRVAVQRSEPSIVNFLSKCQPFRQLIEHVNDATKLLLHDCVSNTKYKLEDDIERRLGVIQLLVDINSELLNEKDEWERTPLLCEYAHVDLLKELIRVGADVSSQDIMGDTILHLSKNQTRRLNAYEYQAIITNISKSKLKQVLSVVANDGDLLLNRLLYFIDPTEETLRILLSQRTDSIQNAFSVGIKHGRTRHTLKALIELGVDCFWKGKDGESYLHNSAYNGNLDALKLLIEDYGADVNIIDDHQRTPMDLAIASEVGSSKENKRFECAMALHKFGGRISNKFSCEKDNVLHQAIRKGNSQSVRIIQEIIKNSKCIIALESGICEETKVTPEFYLSDAKFKSLVRNFKATCNSFRDSNGNTILHLAAERGDENAVKELVENGADLENRNTCGGAPLHRACFCSDREAGLRIIKYLINSGATAKAKNNYNYTFLHLFAAGTLPCPFNPNQFHDIAEYLAGKGLIDLFCIHGGPDGRTPLQRTCQVVELEERTILLLYKNGISFNQFDDSGDSILNYYAILGGRSIRFLNLIIGKCEGDWRMRNKSGSNGLHKAAQCGHLEAMSLYMALGLDPNQINKFGDSPLHRVAEFGKKNILEAATLLVQGGVDVNIKDQDGNTALELALKRRDYGNEFNSEMRSEFIKIVSLRNNEMEVSNKIANGSLSPLLPHFVEPAWVDQMLLHKSALEVDNTDECIEIIKSLIATGADVYSKDEDDYTFLHNLIRENRLSSSQFQNIMQYICQAGYHELIEKPGGKNGASILHYSLCHIEPTRETLQLFKSQKVNFNCLDAKGNSVLVYAIEGKRSTELFTLLTNNFGVNWRHLNNCKRNMIHVAAEYGNEDALQFFVDLGLDINLMDINAETPIYLAVKHPDHEKSISLCQKLIYLGADINQKNTDGESLLHVAARINIPKLVQLFVELGLDVNGLNNYQRTPLFRAARRQVWNSNISIEVIKCLIKNGADVTLIDCDGESLLHYSARFSTTEVVQFFIKLGLNVNGYNNCKRTPLHRAACRQDGKTAVDIIKCLVAQGANPALTDSYGNSALHFSSKWGATEVVQFFLKLGLNANAKTIGEQTPLHHAVWRKDKTQQDIVIDVIKCLIENGADPNSLDSDGNNPLYHAVGQSTQSLPIIKCFLDNGTKVDSLNVYNNNYIHRAARIGGVQVLKFFLDTKALDVNAVDVNGDSSLHFAAIQEESDYVLEKVQILLEHGADINIKNNNGQTALDIAEERTNWDKEVKIQLQSLLVG